MTTSRREFLSACALAGPAGRSFMPAETMRNAAQPAWPSAFPGLRQRINGHPLTFLDSAATTLRPQSVIDAIADYYATDNANPSRVHTLASRAAERLAGARRALATFVNARDAAEVVFVRGTTEGINLVAATWVEVNLRRGDEIVVTIAEHASNLMPWTRAARQAGARVRVVDVDDDGVPRLDLFREALANRPRFVAFSHVSNVLGFVNPAKEMCALARAAGARVLVDGAQAAPHLRVDVQDLDCDFYVFSGHKMFGPMGTGVLWARHELLEEMPPWHVGSNMAHDVDFERAALEHGAQKFQAGTPDVAGPVGLAAAVRFFEAAGPQVRDHDDRLVRSGLDRFAQLPHVRVIGPKRPERRVPVFTFVVEGHSATAVAHALDARGIAVRAGDLAARPLLNRFGVAEAVRASGYVYNTPDDIDGFGAALEELG